jgi:hypothetical protein
LAKEAVFPVKVYASKNRKGKDYFVYKVTIPKKIANELKIKKDDYLLLKASKAEWFHLLDWGEMQPTWTMLPEHMKTRIRESGLKVPEFQVTAPTPLLLPKSNIMLETIPTSTVVEQLQLPASEPTIENFDLRGSSAV